VQVNWEEFWTVIGEWMETGFNRLEELRKREGQLKEALGVLNHQLRDLQAARGALGRQVRAIRTLVDVKHTRNCNEGMNNPIRVRIIVMSAAHSA
jgi:hypothetical protein